MFDRDLDSSAKEIPDISVLREAMNQVIHKMDMSYGLLGSLFRSGSRQTFFSSQVTRYSDLYASTCLNLLYYPFSYMFRAPPMLLPHESTVSHHDYVIDSNFTPGETASADEWDDERNHVRETEMEEQILAQKMKAMIRIDSKLPNLYAPEPDASIQIHDLDNEEPEDEDDA